MRVIVKYDPYNRLGNRMFQYAFGYLLSKKYNCPLLCNDDLPNFGIKSERYTYIDPNVFVSRSVGNQYFDFTKLDNFDGDVVLDGHLQKIDYYKDHKEELRKVFGIKNLEMKNSEKLILHIRETDYKVLDIFLGYDFYKKFIESTGYTDIAIVTDNPKGETIQRLLSEGCTLNTDGVESPFLHHGDRRAIDDFLTLLYSENIAISQSSFAWWGAFLGYHNKVFFPFSTTSKQCWALKPEREDVDLYIDEPSSIKFVL
tara:strand:+ start:7839 stop:8609 length:771 start_codon:yes stop_codon:yes gene_type:complete